tara:strand:- start:628 stop:1248 length:621 start_codon:yes stop_codon:yes gene_type:complete
MIDSDVHSLFAMPVYVTKLKREFTSEENKFTNKIKLRCCKNIGNRTSIDSNIINNKQYGSLRKELNKIVKDYFNKIICSSNNIKPYITQSWLNYTDTNQYHHIHKHPNSLVSGILYINADKDNDRVKFHSNKYSMIEIGIEKFNAFNSSSWWFPVETGQVFLFPSSLSHSVETKKGKNTRISLAFNVFIEGTIGSKEELNELTLRK